MQEDPYIIIFPQHILPGSLVITCKHSFKNKIEEIEKINQAQHYIIRAIISDHIPLAGNINDIIERPANHLLKLNENPLTIYLHHGGNKAFYFDLISDEENNLKYIEVETQSFLPLEAITKARTELNNLLDTIVRSYWMPLLISRIELFIKGDLNPLLIQLHLPFNTEIHLGPLGGFNHFPKFSAFNSLIREAITTNSPYYRFLCAFRLYDGVRHLRKWLKELSKEYSITEKLPSDPPVDLKMLEQMGFLKERISGVKTINDLYSNFTDLRNRVAHFLLKGEKNAISISNGQSYFEYALGGAVFLHYSHLAVSELIKFFNLHFYSHFRRGSILPLKDKRDNFIIR